MLISFKLKNCSSFLEESELSMEATSIRAHAFSLIEEDRHKLLPVAAIYGANASGKTNLIAVLQQALRKIVGGSAGNRTTFVPFLMLQDDENKIAPCKCEIALLIDGITYFYEIYILADLIYREALYSQPRGKKQLMYARSLRNEGENHDEGKISIELGDVLSPNEIGEIEYVHSMEQGHRDLLLTALGKRGQLPWAAGIYQYAEKATFGAAFSIARRGVPRFSEGSSYVRYLSDPDKKAEYLNFARIANPCISNLDKEQLKNQPFDPESQQLDAENQEIKYRLKLRYEGLQGQETEKDFDMTAFESQGTMEALRLYPRINEVLTNGGLLIADELERNLHPLLLAYIVNLFTSPERNPGHGQLVFTTHNTLIMDKKYLRRDEIWFVEKDEKGRSRLYALSDFKGVRSDLDYCKSYILGAFGAIPTRVFEDEADAET